jgi:hypothetical protein
LVVPLQFALVLDTVEQLDVALVTSHYQAAVTQQNLSDQLRNHLSPILVLKHLGYLEVINQVNLEQDDCEVVLSMAVNFGTFTSGRHLQDARLHFVLAGIELNREELIFFVVLVTTNLLEHLFGCLLLHFINYQTRNKSKQNQVSILNNLESDGQRI